MLCTLYLLWTLHFALFCEPVCKASWDCCKGNFSRQAVVLYYGTSLIAWQSQRQSLVSLSSAEAEFTAAALGLSLYGQLQEMTLTRPAYATYCDNAVVIQLTTASDSKTRARHSSMRASWLHHLVQHESVSMQYVPTNHQRADIRTKGLNAHAHDEARKDLRIL